MKRSPLFFVLGFAARLAFSQSGTERPAFDIADVRETPRNEWVKDARHTLQGGFLIGDRYELHRATMLDLIRIAYDVDATRVYGGPSWLDYDRFEVIAKTRAGASPARLRLMLQNLLENRFRLKIKADDKEIPGYVLSRGKGELKLRAAIGDTRTSACQLPGLSISLSANGEVVTRTLQCHGVTMQTFAQALRGSVGNLPVKDSTGLEGVWDIDVQWDQPPGSSGPDSVIDALAKAGLKLEKGGVPQPVLTVESVDRRYTPNSPNLAEVLPPLPSPAFEVASLKECQNGPYTRALMFEPGGRVTATCMPLRSLVTQAWGLANFEQPAEWPKWLDERHNMSVEAKAPAGMTPDPQINAQARDILNAMLRALLTERYRMKVHFEDRPRDAGALVANKPKLTKASDPASRTGCKRESQQSQGRSLLVRVVCRNMTMTQFAEQLPAFDSDLFYPVQDRTGLEGAWDFVLNYDAMAGLNARMPSVFGGAAAAGAQGSEPSGIPSFREAIDRQLGLKLEIEKRPEPVLVIDSMEETPIPN